MRHELVSHEIGRLSKAGVLDVGLKCPHSCEFCYYSYLDGSDDQFKGMREATFRPLDECKAALDFFAAQGLERLDITGGEPLHHPDIVEIVRYAEQEVNLRVRLITLAQLFERKDKWTGRRLLDALVEDAGITEFLISLHAVDPALYNTITRGHFSRVEKVLDELDAREFVYCTNSTVYASNASHMPAVASYLVERKRRVHVSNFITMNAYYAWATGKAFGVQARYSDLAGPLREATRILEGAGIGVNVRYGPYCAQAGLEKNLVGILGNQLDPYEWRNTVRNPFLITARTERDNYETKRRDLRSYGKVFPDTCAPCSVKAICDGIDTAYLQQYGDAELRPYDGPAVRDVVHFRRGNPSVFLLKQRAVEQGAAPQRPSPPRLAVGLRMKRKALMLRLAIRNIREEMRRGEKIVADLMKRPSDAFHTGMLIVRSLVRVVRT